MAVAVFDTKFVKGTVLFTDFANGVKVEALFTHLPPGEHGFHIHKNGDLREKGCKGACEHFHVGPPQHHGGPPKMGGQRHTGDLGNVSIDSGKKTYTLRGIHSSDLLGRSMIIHQDEDDYGKGGFEDSLTTGHSGARIACAIIGRTKDCA
jgi:Cu-Zn family superoxide dismutase